MPNLEAPMGEQNNKGSVYLIFFVAAALSTRAHKSVLANQVAPELDDLAHISTV